MRVGESTRYDWTRPVRPFASASLCYRQHPAGEAYAAWLQAQNPMLEREDDDTLEELSAQVAAAQVLLEEASALGGPSRQRRLSGLLRAHSAINDPEGFRQRTREVLIPAEVLPLPLWRAAMASAVADELFDWQREFRQAGLADVQQRQQRAGAVVERLDAAEWTEDGRRAIAAVRDAARGERPAPPPAPVLVQPMVSCAIDPAQLGERTHKSDEYTTHLISNS